MAEEDGASFLRSFASAMLERSLPAIREWLASRFGPTARIGPVTLDQGQVVVKDSHLPIGARLFLDVDEAILDARPEDLMAGLPPARLRSLRGAVRAVEGGKTTFLAPVLLEGRGSASMAWVDAEVRVGGATWELDRGVGDALPMYGTGRVVITSEGWQVLGANLTSGASQTKLDARGSLGEGGAKLLEAVLGTRFARLGHGLDVLAAFRGQDLRLPLPIPLDAICDGTVSLAENGTLTIDGTARTDASDLALKLTSKDRRIEHAELTGTVSPLELLPEWLDRLVDRENTEPFALASTFKGALDALDATVDLELPALASPWLRAPRPAGAKIHLRGGRRWTIEVAIDDAGTGQVKLGVAPYGSLDGAAHLDLEPGAWTIDALTAEGEPVQIDAQIGGTRTAPELAVELAGTAVAVRRAGAPLALRRPRADAKLVLSKDGLRIERAQAQARVGPGSAAITRDATTTRVRLARVDAADALAGLGLAIEQRWIGLDDAARFRVPDGAQLWGELALEAGRVSGTAHVETARSRLSLSPLRFEAGSFDGTEGQATVAIEDAVALGLFGGSPVIPTGPDKIDLQAKLTGHGADARLAAIASTRRLDWRWGERDPQLPLEKVRVELELTRDAIEVKALTATLLGGRVEARGGLRREGEAFAPRLDALTLRGAQVRERLLGERAGEAWRGLTVDLDLAGSLATLEGRATARSERSVIEATLRTRDATFAEGSSLCGEIDPRDLAPWLGPLAIDGDAMTVSANVEGPWTVPSVALEVRGGAQHVAFGPLRAPLADLRLRAALGPDGVDVPEASAVIAGGRVSLSAVGSTAFGGSVARVRVEGVRLGDITRVADELKGALHLDAVAWRRGEGAPGARVSARVEQPVYALTSRFAALFSRYGLRQPERSSSKPATAALRLVDGQLEVTDVEAGTESFAVKGAATRTALGVWHGDATVVAKQTWLETSHLFASPARWIGDVRVPIHVDGPDGQVRVRADVLATLDTVLAKTRLGRGLQRAIEALMRTLRFQPGVVEAPPARPHATSALTTSDALVDAIARNTPEADAAIDALLERGLEPRELVDKVIRRR